jgi:hypothetical protein
MVRASSARRAANFASTSSFVLPWACAPMSELAGALIQEKKKAA